MDGYCSGFPKEQAGMLENMLGDQGTSCFNNVRRSGYAGTLLEVNVLIARFKENLTSSR